MLRLWITREGPLIGGPFFVPALAFSTARDMLFDRDAPRKARSQPPKSIPTSVDVDNVNFAVFSHLRDKLFFYSDL